MPSRLDTAQALLHPLGHREKPSIVAGPTHQLDADGKPARPGEPGDVDARRAEEGPDSVEDRVAGTREPLGRFAGGAGGEEGDRLSEDRGERCAALAGQQLGGIVFVRCAGRPGVEKLEEVGG